MKHKKHYSHSHATMPNIYKASEQVRCDMQKEVNNMATDN